MPAEIQERSRPRQFPRFMAPDRNPAGFITSSHRIAAELHKVSLRGLFLRTEGAVPVGSVGKVGVDFGNWFFRATAVVRSVEPGRGLGLEFISMSSLDRQALQAFCASHRRLAVRTTAPAG